MAKAMKQGVRKKVKGYKMPDPLPKGEVLEDVFKKQWRLGTSIGKGGFGEIYSAQSTSDTSKANAKYPYVIKIEPHNNGPLFVEMHFYMRNAKQADINAFMSSKKLNSLGMPVYLGSGSHEYKGEKYRFIVMEKFGTDIWKMFLENKKSFPVTTVFRIGLQILDVLEYIHSQGYVHGDVKGSNILLSLSDSNQVYLVDFGLAEHYTTKEFKPDPKKAHNGTIEYLSCDAHLGVQTRRGDLEILGYNLIQWLGCTLPWENNLKDPTVVQKSKEKHLTDITGFLKTCFGDGTPPDAIRDYLKYVTTLKFDAQPDYKKLHKMLLSGLESAGGSLKTPLKFTALKSPIKRKNNLRQSLSPGKKQKLKKKVIKTKNKTGETSDTDEEITSKKPSNKHILELPEKDLLNEGDVLDVKLTERQRNKKLKEGTSNEDINNIPVTKNRRGISKLQKQKVSDSEDEVNESGDEESDGDADYIQKLQKKSAITQQTSKKRVPKSIDTKENEEKCEETNGFTAEMKRVKQIIDGVKSTKKNNPRTKRKNSGGTAQKLDSVPSTSGFNPGRNRRNLKTVNYNEDSIVQSRALSVDASNSDSELPTPPKLLKKRHH